MTDDNAPPVTVTKLDEGIPHALYKHYDGETTSQSCHIALDLRTRTLSASYNPDPGNGRPTDVRHRRVRWWPIPCLTAASANRLMRELVEPAQRLLDDSSVKRKGNVYLGLLGTDAEAAEREITEIIAAQLKRRLHTRGKRATRSRSAQARDLELVHELDARTWFRSVRTNVFAETTDKELADIVAEHERNAATTKPHAYTVLLNLTSYLLAEREKLRNRQRRNLETTADRIKKNKVRRNELIVQVRSFGDTSPAIAPLADLTPAGVRLVLKNTTYKPLEGRNAAEQQYDRNDLKEVVTRIKRDERRRDRLIVSLDGFGDSAPAIAQLADLSKTAVGNTLKRMASTEQSRPIKEEQQQ